MSYASNSMLTRQRTGIHHKAQRVSLGILALTDIPSAKKINPWILPFWGNSSSH